MQLQHHDRQITISTAGNRRSLHWPAQGLWWSEFVQRLATPLRGKETLAEYLRMPKSQQDDLKDVGGFVGGELDGGRRKGRAVLGRDLVTLDMDAIPALGADAVLKQLEAMGCAYAVYSTRKHEPARPRLRVILPLSRTVTAEEYEAIARKLAAMIDIAWCDPTTFQAVRMMYWPSCCADSEYIFQYGDKPHVSADGMLGLYADWRDTLTWPQVPGVQKATQRLLRKQENPTTKTGAVGAFCKVYNVYQAMDAFIPGLYEPTDTGDGRYTYTEGSTAGGAVVYDDGLYLYSHHATDPCGGQLVNAFDMVRLHLFGSLDDAVKEGTPIGKHPSYTAMRKLAMEDNAVSLLLSQERLQQTREDFGDLIPGYDDNWLLELEKNPNTGRYERTVNNLLLILRNDPFLRDKLAYDEFANQYTVIGTLPWNPDAGRRKWTDADDNALFWYVEHRYRITGEKALLKAVDIVARERSFNDVQAYILGLAWDGIPRLDTLLIDYLNAEDTRYTRAVTRKMFVAAIARAMAPGTKFDYSLILVGKQGKGKSTLLRYMGGRWFLEDLPPTFEGKDASERIQGYWLAEMGELTGLTRSEVNVAKQFLSRTVDVYRAPYGRNTEEHPRRCVIFGSTNEDEFLRDSTGNRRFWPVTLLDAPGRRSVFDDLPDNVNQLWAEAKARWQLGERLYLEDDVSAEALAKQDQYKVGNAKAGIIGEFLDRPLPEGWDTRDISARRLYWSNDFAKRADSNLTPRRYVCAAEVWCECFGQDKGRMKQSDTREINGLLRELGWVSIGLKHSKVYGRQRSYRCGTDGGTLDGTDFEVFRNTCESVPTTVPVSVPAPAIDT